MKAERTTKRRRVLRRYSAEDRERFIREYEESGLSRRDFCARRGINLTTFHGWFHMKPRDNGARVNPPSPPFAEVKLAGGVSVPIEVLLSNGVRVQIRHNGSTDLLANLIRKIAGCGEDQHTC